MDSLAMQCVSISVRLAFCVGDMLGISAHCSTRNNKPRKERGLRISLQAVDFFIWAQSWRALRFGFSYKFTDRYVKNTESKGQRNSLTQVHPHRTQNRCISDLPAQSAVSTAVLSQPGQNGAVPALEGKVLSESVQAEAEQLSWR